MELKIAEIKNLRPAEYNPRKRTEHVLKTVRESIKDYGFIQPVIINQHECPECGNRKGVIIGGHRRIDAAKVEGLKEIQVVELNLHLKDEKVANLRFNAQEEFKKYELATMIEELSRLDASVTQTIGLTTKQLYELLFAARYTGNKKVAGILRDKFLIPPFSIFDSKQEYWQRRKKLWIEALGDMAETRESKLAGSEKNLLIMGTNSGVSIFDPVVSEVIFSWFIPENGGSILDPFAGSLARGGVAATLGYQYTGIEIRSEQIEANERRLQELGEEISKRAKYILGDANNLKKLVPEEEKFDLIFTSPPYYDLEIYSDKEADLSAKPSYKEFMEGYERIFAHAAEHLKPNRFIVLEIGDIRDEDGFYRNFIGDNITMFERLGFKLYNEIIYAQMLATAPQRAERNMHTRKVVKTHQNIMTFYKGDPSLLKNPQTLEVHRKVLAFFRGKVDEIKKDFRTPVPIQHDVVEKLRGEYNGDI